MSKSSCSECESAAPMARMQLCETVIGKVIMSTVLLYMLYIAITCPCKPLYDCHITELYMSVGVIVAVLIYFNGLRVRPLLKYK